MGRRSFGSGQAYCLAALVFVLTHPSPRIFLPHPIHQMCGLVRLSLQEVDNRRQGQRKEQHTIEVEKVVVMVTKPEVKASPKGRQLEFGAQRSTRLLASFMIVDQGLGPQFEIDDFHLYWLVYMHFCSFVLLRFLVHSVTFSKCRSLLDVQRISCTTYML